MKLLKHIFPFLIIAIALGASIFLHSCKKECDCVRYLYFNFRLEDGYGHDLIFGSQAIYNKDSIRVEMYLNDSTSAPVFIEHTNAWPESYMTIEIIEDGGFFLIRLDSADTDTLRVELEEDRCLCGQASVIIYNNKLLCNHCDAEEPFVFIKP